LERGRVIIFTLGFDTTAISLLRTKIEIETEQRQRQPIELDESELKKYVDFVIREVRKKER
jgi:hypothetical protein